MLRCHFARSLAYSLRIIAAVYCRRRRRKMPPLTHTIERALVCPLAAAVQNMRRQFTA